MMLESHVNNSPRGQRQTQHTNTEVLII